MRFVPSQPFEDRLLTGLIEVGNVEGQGQHVLMTGTGGRVNAVILSPKAHRVLLATGALHAEAAASNPRALTLEGRS